MAMPGEFEFYATRSGLPATATLAEHKRAFWCAQLGLPYPQFQWSLGELELLFIRTSWVPNPPNLSLDEARARYFRLRTGLPAGLASSDYAAAFFLNPPSSSPTIALAMVPVGPNVPAATGSVLLRATVTGFTPAAPLELYYQSAAVVAPEFVFLWGAPAFTDMGGGIWERTFPLAGETGNSYWFSTKDGAVVSNLQQLTVT